MAIPFLADRGKRSLGLLRKLSIVYPTPLPSADSLYDLVNSMWVTNLSGSLWSDENMWEELCCFLSFNVPALAQLDLRTHKDPVMSGKVRRLKSSGWKRLQTPTNFPAKRVKELATLGPETVLTISDDD